MVPSSLYQVYARRAVAGLALLAATAGASGPQSGPHGLAPPSLTRLAVLPQGAEATGLFLTEAGELFFNLQHPSAANRPPFHRATVGVLTGVYLRRVPREFEPVPLPDSDSDRQKVTTAVGSYRVLAQSGDTLGGALAEGLGTIRGKGGTVIHRSDSPDFNAVVPTPGDGSEKYLFTAWEERPGGVSRIRLRRDAAGKWEAVEKGSGMLGFQAVKGTWVSCFGTLSPWGTPLSSEELYFPDTAKWNAPEGPMRHGPENLARYLGYRDFARQWPNPYDYGYIVEITDPAGAAVPRKRPALGRFSHENAVVMPDRRTVYLSDDGTGTVLFRFVADRAGDLSAGTLYAARVTQDRGVSDPARAGFGIRWVRLGQGEEEAIAGWIDDYDDIGWADYQAGDTSYISDTQVCHWAEAKSGGDLNCDADGAIGPAPFGDDRVAFLESRKAAAALGATAEFRKMEGINIQPGSVEKGGKPSAYLAMSEITATMADGAGRIRLDANPCGVVYRLRFGRDYRANRLEPVIAGSQGGPGGCSVHGIANPDNLVVMADGRVIIGEDTGRHANNMLWVLDTGKP